MDNEFKGSTFISVRQVLRMIAVVKYIVIVGSGAACKVCSLIAHGSSQGSIMWDWHLFIHVRSHSSLLFFMVTQGLVVGQASECTASIS